MYEKRSLVGGIFENGIQQMTLRRSTVRALVLLSRESYGRLKQPHSRFLNELDHLDSATGIVCKSSIIDSCLSPRAAVVTASLLPTLRCKPAWLAELSFPGLLQLAVCALCRSKIILCSNRSYAQCIQRVFVSHHNRESGRG